MTPLEIEILIHYHCCSSDFENITASAVIQAIGKFVQLGLLKQDLSEDAPSNYYANKEALNLYIDAICKVSLPKQKWILE